MLTIPQLDEITRLWTDAAARGETAWICADCGANFSAGMPDICAYGHASCTSLLLRDRIDARRESVDE